MLTSDDPRVMLPAALVLWAIVALPYVAARLRARRRRRS